MVNSRFRHFALLACGLGLLGFAISSALLPSLLLRVSRDFSVSPEYLSWVVATQFLCCFVAAILGGVLSDHYGKKPVLVVASALLTLGSILWAESNSVVMAHVAAGLLGMGGGILEGLGSALLLELYPQRRALVLNLSQMVYCAGAVAGPAVVALSLTVKLSWRTIFYVEAGIGVIILGLYAIATVPRIAVTSSTGCFAGFTVLRNWKVLLLALALGVYVLVESVLAVYLNLHLQRHHAAPESWAVLGISAFWGAMLLGRLGCALLPHSWSGARLIYILVISGAIALCAQSFAHDWRVSFLLFALAGLLLAGLWPAIVTLAASIDSEHSGSVIGSVIAIGSLGVAIAPLVATVVINGGGGNQLFLFMSIALCAIIPILRFTGPVRL